MFLFQYNTRFSGVSTPKMEPEAAETVLWDNDWRFHAGARLRGIIKGIKQGINWGIIKSITMCRPESFRNRKGSFFMSSHTYRFRGIRTDFHSRPAERPVGKRTDLHRITVQKPRLSVGEKCPENGVSQKFHSERQVKNTWAENRKNSMRFTTWATMRFRSTASTGR